MFYSAVELEDQEKTPRFLERTFLAVTPTDSRLQGADQADPVAGIRAAGGLTAPPSGSPDPRNLTWSIRQEVEKLMEDQNKPSSTSSQAGKAKKPQVRRQGTVSVCKVTCEIKY